MSRFLSCWFRWRLPKSLAPAWPFEDIPDPVGHRMIPKVGQLPRVEEDALAGGTLLQPDMRLIGNGNRCHGGVTDRTIDFSDLVKPLTGDRISRIDAVAVGVGPEEPVPLE